MRSHLVMYNPKIWLQYLHSFPRYWPKKLVLVPLSPKHEYKGEYSKSHSKVTNKIIMVKMILFYTICHLVFISEVKLKLSCAKHRFWKFWFRSLTSFKMKLKCEWVRKMSHEPQIRTILVSMQYDKKTRWVDGTPTTEVPPSLCGRSIHLTLVTKWSWSWSWMTNCHPFVQCQSALPLWDTAISKFDHENPWSRSCVLSTVRVMFDL